MVDGSPRYRKAEILRTVLTILADAPEGLPAATVLEQVEERMELTPREQGVFESSGERRFPTHVRFSTIGAVKAGWLLKNKMESNRGYWEITSLGRSAISNFPDNEGLTHELSRLYRQWEDSRPDIGDDQGDEPEIGLADQASITLEQATEDAWKSVERHLVAMEPYRFQDLVSGLLIAMGYHVQWVAPPGPDGGIDIVATTDPLGASGTRLKVQVKRQAKSVAADGLRSFMAVLGNDDAGIFVCTGGFSREAWREARQQERRRITLLDLQRFFSLWIEHYENLPESARNLLPLRPVHFLSLDV
jgi:restriction system protein